MSNCKDSGTRRAAVYTRVSTAGQAEDGTSLDTQEAGCRDFVKQHDYALIGVWSDQYSGAYYRDRLGLSEMRDAIRDGLIDVVVAYSVDRLSRNQAHLAILLEEGEEYGTRFEFVTEDFEDSPTGRFILAAKAFAAEVEREKMTERTIRGRRERVRGGKPVFGSRKPYALEWNETEFRFVAKPTEALIVKRIFREALERKPLRKICEGLNRDGIPTPSGKTVWQPATVRYLLLDERYTGKGSSYRTKTERRGGRYHRVETPEDWPIELPEGTFPRIIEPADFDTAKQVLAENKARSIRNNRDPEGFLLRAGFIFCGQCTSAMTTKTEKDRKRYRCEGTDVKPCRGTSITAANIDAVVWERVTAILNQPDIISQELERLRAHDPTETDLAELDKALAELDRKIEVQAKILQEFDDPEAAQSTVQHIQRLNEQRRNMESQREEVNERRQTWELDQSRLKGVEEWCRSVAERLDTLSYEQKRDALAALGVRVSIYPESHAERYRIEFSLPLNTEFDSEILYNTPTRAVQNRLILLWTSRDVAAMAAD